MTLAYSLEDARVAPPASALVEVMDRQAVRTSFARDEEIYGQGDEVEYLHRVIRGAVRTMRLANDGRRQVGDFYTAGEMFGLEPGPDHRFSAEALCACEIQVLRRSAVRAFAGDAELDRAILEATQRELNRAQEHMLLLGRRGARERVAAFLLGLAEGRICDVELPMGRQDIADYLGLTIETVSRTLTQLQGEAVVEFPSFRRFRVRNWDVLGALAD